MPFGDKTGPLGQGPMTGRGRGFCAGNAAPGRLNSAPGLGMGKGGCGANGWRNRFRAGGLYAGETPTAVPPAPTDRQQEIAALKAAVGGLVTTLARSRNESTGWKQHRQMNRPWLAEGPNGAWWRSCRHDRQERIGPVPARTAL